MKISEKEIPGLIKQGKDKEVIPELYKKVFPQVKRYILRNKGGQDDALDIFQDSIIYFYRLIVNNEFNEKYPVYGFLYRVAVNRWINKAKRDKRIVLSDEINEYGLQMLANQDEEKQSTSESENLLEKFFSSIGEKCIEILTYTIYYNLMAEDIAIRMEMGSEGAVKMKLKRCREKLFEEVEKNPSLLDKLRNI